MVRMVDEIRLANLENDAWKGESTLFSVPHLISDVIFSGGLLPAIKRKGLQLLIKNRL
ncbi:hypothetical protein ACNKHK_14680 [Shigella flexneri]